MLPACARSPRPPECGRPKDLGHHLPPIGQRLRIDRCCVLRSRCFWGARSRSVIHRR
jgi:hypothetical protein